jgi:maltooligosyltrehalose trehalohydrolase
MRAERLAELVDFESLKLAAGALLLSPYVPLLFMGEEYGEEARFRYFVSHTDEALIRAVREGRREEFKAFEWDEEAPDPQAVSTFEASRLQWDRRTDGVHRILLAFYKQLLQLRSSIPRIVSKKGMAVQCMEDLGVLTWLRKHSTGQVHGLLNFGRQTARFPLNPREGGWTKVMDSADIRWRGPGATLPDAIVERQEVAMPPRSIAVYRTGARPESWRAQAIAEATRPRHVRTTDAYTAGNL